MRMMAKLHPVDGDIDTMARLNAVRSELRVDSEPDTDRERQRSKPS
jgi:hypothetical protein